MFGKRIQTNMESEIIEQKKIIPYILMKYINPETSEIKIDLPQNITKIVLVASGSSYHCGHNHHYGSAPWRCAVLCDPYTGGAYYYSGRHNRYVFRGYYGGSVLPWNGACNKGTV